MEKELSPILNNAGLNLYAVFDTQDLPQDIQSSIQAVNIDIYRQLIIFAHGGKKMWQALQNSPFQSVTDPIDSFSCHTVQQYFEQEHPDTRFQVIFPSDQQAIPLQKLGTLAGWHHESPFRIGINQEYGSWFAYRVAVLADTNIKTSQPMTAPSPCGTCTNQPCITACPADALTCGELSLQTCLNYRLRTHSKCKDTCLSRLACPISKEHCYCQEQINYHYAVSIKTIYR